MSQLRIDETKTSIRQNKTLFYLSKTAFYFVYISFLLSDWSALLAYLALSVCAVLKVRNVLYRKAFYTLRSIVASNRFNLRIAYFDLNHIAMLPIKVVTQRSTIDNHLFALKLRGDVARHYHADTVSVNIAIVHCRLATAAARRTWNDNHTMFPFWKSETNLFDIPKKNIFVCDLLLLF